MATPKRKEIYKMSLSLSYTFSPTTTIESSQVNQNFTDIINYVNNTACVAGMVMLWSGSIATIPTGWQLCNGTNDAPDLRDKFVIGAGNLYNPDATGGASTINLLHSHTVDAHSHGGATGSTGGSTDSQGSHDHLFSGTTAGDGDTNSRKEGTGSNTCSEENHNHAFSGTTGNGGYHSHSVNSHSHDIATTSPDTNSQLSSSQSIMPPYYALAYIIKL